MVIITCAQFGSHSSPLFKSLQTTKLFDLVAFHIAIFMHKFHNQLLPATFQSYLTRVTNVHSYSDRFASKQSYYIPYARTNYGKLNVRFNQFRLAFLRVAQLGGWRKVSAAYNSRTINGNVMKFGGVVKDH